MAGVGRNDPCPCGSGRKYKNCCMRRTELDRSQRQGVDLVEAALMHELQQFALNPRFQQDLDASFEIYWGGAYDYAGLGKSDEGSLWRWLEWFALDYRVGPDRRRPVEGYAEGPGRELPDELQPALKALADATVGLYRVERTAPPRLVLHDTLRDAEQTADDRVLSRTARPGDVLVARAWTLDGVTRLTAASLLLPAEFEVGMAEYVRNAYRTYVAERGKSTWDEFLRANGHIMMAYLMSYRAEALRPLIGPGTRFHDPLMARDRMREYTLAKRDEAQRQAYADEYAGAAERRTSSGLVVLDDSAPEIVPGARGKEESGRPSILLPGRDG